LAFVVDSDYPQNWPNLIEYVVTKMQESKNTAGLYASLAVVRRLVGTFEYFLGDKRMPMRAIIIRIFPYLENLMAN